MARFQRRHVRRDEMGEIHMIIGLMKGLLLIAPNAEGGHRVNYLIAGIRMCRQQRSKSTGNMQESNGIVKRPTAA